MLILTKMKKEQGSQGIKNDQELEARVRSSNNKNKVGDRT